MSNSPLEDVAGSVPLVDDVRGFLSEELERAVDSITPESRLWDDLGVDSVVLLALFDELAGKHQVATSFKELASLAREYDVRTVADLVAFIEEHRGVRSETARETP